MGDSFLAHPDSNPPLPANPVPSPRQPVPGMVNMHEAKTQLSRLVEAIETGEHGEIVIARSGRPVARLTALEPSRRRRRLGVAHGQFTAPGSIDAANPQIAGLFGADQAGTDQYGAD